jgi:hypothetical protein
MVTIYPVFGSAETSVSSGLSTPLRDGGWLFGWSFHTQCASTQSQAPTTGLLNGAIVGGVLKLGSQRQRPVVDDMMVNFGMVGHHFFRPLNRRLDSRYGHCAKNTGRAAGSENWSIWIGCRGSISRYTGQKHFLSDVLVGSAIGYGVGRYVYMSASRSALDDVSQRR